MDFIYELFIDAYDKNMCLIKYRKGKWKNLKSENSNGKTRLNAPFQIYKTKT